ncbi:TetR/AcrR family transcriptional regulator C-terminal domain-containing protein [Clostridium estertheticum]|uniref:TetR/AcrR family transcriptional regulator C-terminal domain-containing protein n=1 Tax=Clostridium estertheticum TaxID=238834 RepID=UPI001CF4DF8F|nr:TetR/AcrR family transcriptional regulator C-terminal domain-containing protein [Clostridium estertheticum]MCB2354184.1 TetR/AcrR family transcriptional regulator [Clostridium estertheticum]WAG43315.1 TetR/AcrR family transcriptional regulator [Clostridium estertheticum]
MNHRKTFNLALQKLLGEYSFDDITVDMILCEAELSRSTFYRYFSDKYNLLAWNYEEGTRKIIWDNCTCTWEERQKKIYMFLGDNLTYYQKALQTDKLDTFWNFLYQFVFDYCKQAVMKKRNTRILDEKDIVTIKYISRGSVFVLLDWVKRGGIESAENMAKYTYDFLSPEYRDIFNSM